MATSPLSLPVTLQLVITFSSLSCACVAGFYVHPLLLPMFSSSVPRLGSAMRTYLTPPILFILLNLLVVAVFATSSMMPLQKRKQGTGVIISNICSIKVGGDDDGANDGCAAAFACEAVHVSKDHNLTHDVPCNNLIADVAEDNQKCHSPPELRNRKNAMHRTRLVRSKSDGIIVVSPGQRTPSGLRPVRLLKKAGTFESTGRRRRVRPVVVVADPPGEGQIVAEEEVDKKAEEFIGRFYQRMKLQGR